jgi:hypothetical protein
MKRKRPVVRALHDLKQPNRHDLPDLVRALDDVEPPDQWDAILGAALDPDRLPVPMPKLAGRGRDRHPLLQVAAAASVVLAVAGSVLAVRTDNPAQVTMAKLGIISEDDVDDGDPPSTPRKEGEKGGGSSDDGSADAVAPGSRREPRQNSGDDESSRDSDSGSTGDELPADPDVGPPPDGALEGNEGTSPPDDVPSDEPGSPTSPPTTTTTPTTVPAPPEIWGQLWVAVELRGPTETIVVADVEAPQPPLLDLRERGTVLFSWCDGFSMRAEVRDGRLQTEPEPLEGAPTSVCGEVTGRGEALMRTLLGLDPDVELRFGPDELTLAAGSHSADFVLQP